MLEVKMESGSEIYIMLSDVPIEEGLIGMAQCKYCDATMFISYVDDEAIVRQIEMFANEHKCNRNIVNKQQLLEKIRDMYYG